MAYCLYRDHPPVWELESLIIVGFTRPFLGQSKQFFRYLFDRKPSPFLMDRKIPHLGTLFKREGYRTGLFGKSQMKV